MLNATEPKRATEAANDFAAQGVASAMAIPAMPVLAPGKKWAGVALGTSAGKSALGLAFGYQVNENFNIGAGVATASGSGDRLSGRIQAGLAW